jgi:hypothetical protein
VTETLIVIYLLLRKYYGVKIGFMERLIEKANKINKKIKLGSFRHSIVRWFIRKFIKKKRTKPLNLKEEKVTT